MEGLGWTRGRPTFRGGGEDVGVFRFVPGGGCLIATRQSFKQGETFTSAGDAAAEELDE